MPTTLTAHGVLRPDGWIELRSPVALPLEPQEVDVVVTLSDSEVASDWPVDASPMPFMSAPFDLPYLTPGRPVVIRPGGERLPSPVVHLIEDVPE